MEDKKSFVLTHEHKGWQFLEWVLFFLVVFSMTFSVVRGLNEITVYSGFFVAALFLIYCLGFARRLFVTREVVLYFVWILWSLNGIFFVAEPINFLGRYITNIQIFAAMWLCAGIISIRGNITILMWGNLLGGILAALVGFLTGEIFYVWEINEPSRYQGFLENPNELAFFLVLSLSSLIYFLNTGKISKLIVIGLMVLVLYLIVATGGRAAFGVSLLLIFLSLDKREARRKPLRFLIKLFALLLIVFSIVLFTLDNTYLGKRLGGITSDGSSLERQYMYHEGAELFKRNPIWGIGLDEFRHESITGQYSHSDYLEVLVGTGIPGFLIYYSIFISLYLGCVSLEKSYEDNEQIRKTLSLLRGIMIILLIYSLSRAHIRSKNTWLLLSGISGYLFYLRQKLKREIS